MANIQLFESDVATNPRIELFFDDATQVLTVPLINAADSIVKTLTLTNAVITLMKAIWRNSSNDIVCIEGGRGTVGVPTYWAAFTRNNAMSWNISEGSTPEVAVLSISHTAEIMAWIIGGRHQPSA